MLLSFRVENHRSLRDEQELILVPAEQSSDGFPSPAETDPLRATGIFGANASGKSSVVRALQFMQRMVRGGPYRWSHVQTSYGPEEEDPPQIPREPFLLDRDSRERPSGFAVELLLNGRRYSYGFTVDDTSVVAEWLHVEASGAENQVIFEREHLNFTYGRDNGSPELTDLLNIDPSTLLISVLASASPTTFHSEAVTALSRVRLWFRSSLRVVSGDVGALRGNRPPSGSPELLSRLTDLARAVDTGIDGYKVERPPLTAEERAEVEANVGPERATDIIRDRADGRVSFQHRGVAGESSLEYHDESSGTRVLLRLGTTIMMLLERGGTLVVDEIDTSLHTLLSGSLISLFKDPENNPNGAQLIFTSHDTSLLGRVHGREVLTEDEIWLTEKGADGATSLFPMSSYESSGEENRDRRYLVGRYGAVPFVDEELLIKALRPRSVVPKNPPSGEETPHEEGP
jgi:hypothetical protein